MSLYLLDKNVVEDIRHSLNGRRSPNIRVAREIDRKGSIVSPLLAIVEGSARRPPTASELHAGLIEACQAVRSFYVHARTDAGALEELAVEMVATFGVHTADKASKLMPLAAAYQTLLSTTRSLRDAREVLQKIDALADEHLIPRAHPLVSCAISCLYGNTGARKVLKPARVPTEGDAYNAVFDIRLLLESAYIRQMWQEDRPWERVALHTGDKQLNEFARMLPIMATRLPTAAQASEENIAFTSTLPDALLPNLQRDQTELARVLEYLRGSR